MSGIATGVFKKLSFKKQTALKTKAPAGAGGTARYMRRVTSTLDLAKASYQSQEINESQQVRDMRHGVRSVPGTINGELSVGGYQRPMESVLRQVAQNAATSGALTTVAAAAVGTDGGTFTRTGGDFIADGFKIGRVVRASGFAAPALDNNDHNFMIVDLTATVMTVISLDKRPVVVRAAGDNVTIAEIGKKTWVPQSGHTRDYYTIEHWFSDVGTSEQFVDCVFTGFTATLPPTGMATISLPVMGLDMQTGNAEYFTAPQASPTGPIVAAVNGLLIVNGQRAGLVTGITIVVGGNYTAPGGVVGENVDPDILPGVLTVTGQITVLFADTIMRDLFINEEEGMIALALTGDNRPNSEFVSFVMSRVKYSGSTKDDQQQGLSLTMPYQALEDIDGGAGTPNVATSISIQDSMWI